MASRPASEDSRRQSPSGRPSGGGFALLSPAFLDELRNRTSLSALIGRSVKLQKAGNEYKAPCPFHSEKTPSFYVNDDKQFYHCFGCGAHGDAIRFLTEARGLAFMDAVKELADAAGLDLPQPDPVSRERAERAAGLHDVMAEAERWFARQLAAANGSAGRAYLDKRGISAATRERFGFGFAPDSRSQLGGALSRFSRAMLIEAGLLIQPEDDREAYDRFRGRLMIPIADQRGRVIAFGGRIIGEGEPKYLNSPDTPLFDKGSTLFNLHRAAPASRKSGRLIVVEGYLDVAALDQAGIAESVAPLGTALTERQMERLWALVDTPILCFDGDAAGQKAALRAAERAMPLIRPGKSLAFARLPLGMDPDDVVKRGGAAAFEALLARPTSLLELLYAHERDKGDMSQPEARAGLRARLNELADRCEDRIVAQEYRRSFNDLFFEEFGFKKAERRAIVSAALHTRSGPKLSVRDHFVRSALYGLSCHPHLLRARVELVSGLYAESPRLQTWRDTLVRAVYRGVPLDDDAIRATLEADGLADLLNYRLSEDQRFPHTRKGIGDARRIEALDGLLAVLNEERELDAALRALDGEAVAESREDAYLAIEAERNYLRGRRTDLLARAFQLGGGDQEQQDDHGEDER